MRVKLLVSLVALMTSGVGCELAGPAQQPEEPRRSGVNTASEEGGEHHEHRDGEERASAAQEPITGPVEAGTKAPPEAARVAAADLLANPEQYRGKRVVVSGTVKGFCHHRRAWFAIDVPEASPPYLRVVTAPAFRVPGGIMGASATTHGTVEIVEVPRARVAHYEEEHRLGSPAGGEESTTTTRAIFRAEGAAFAPPSS